MKIPFLNLANLLNFIRFYFSKKLKEKKICEKMTQIPTKSGPVIERNIEESI